MIEITNKPTQQELDTFFDVLEWTVAWHKKHEPYATMLISAAEEVQNQMPYEADELGVIE
jgi:hypothetical protein